MSVQEFAADFAVIASRSVIAPGRPLRWTVIANPLAGGFTMKARWKKHRETLRAYASAALADQQRPATTELSRIAEPSRTARSIDIGNGSLGALGLVPTARPQHAAEIVRTLLDEVAAESGPGPAPIHLLVTAGGDGTSLEALTALFQAPPPIRARFIVLRLPMGTGNDGADARELADALDLLLKPTRVELGRAVTLSTSTPGKGPFTAFNILSVGLDAFVTGMTNKMKGKLPGDSYKLWVDIATLFYDRFYKVEPMSVSWLDEAGRPGTGFTDPLLLLAMGASGNRTYGSNVRILPDARNVCAVTQCPVVRRIVLKALFLGGRHAEVHEARLFTASRVELRYGQPILAQMDGETVALEPRDFPVTLALSEPAIPSLKIL